MKTRIIRSFVQTALLCLTISQLAGFANAQDAPKKADIPPAADKPALTKPAETPAAQTPAAAPAPTPPGTITYSGLVDWFSASTSVRRDPMPNPMLRPLRERRRRAVR